MSANLSVNKEGEVNFAYTGEKPWHKSGIEVPATMSVMEGLTFSRNTWDVDKHPMTCITNEGVVDVPDHFAVVRSDTQNILGVVGNRYECVSNVEAFSFFDMVLGQNNAQIETVGALGLGERVFMIAKLPQISEIVKGDIVEKYLLVSTSHNGSTGIEILFTDVRVVCANTLSVALRNTQNKLKIRHSKNWESKMKESERTIRESQKYWNEIELASKHLASTSVDRVIVGDFLEKMFPKAEDAKTKTQDNKREKVLELVESGMGTEIQGVRGTAWGLYNAYTEYLDHHTSVHGIEKDDRQGLMSKRWENSNFSNTVIAKRQTAFDYLVNL